MPKLKSISLFLIIISFLSGITSFSYSGNKATVSIDTDKIADITDFTNDNKSCSNIFDRILIDKSEKTLALIDTEDCIIKTYKVRIGKNSGPKQCEGDKKTPEGIYHIVDKFDSKYHRFLAIDYPQQKDIKKAKELGCNPGNAIGIHYYNEEFAKNGDELEGSLGCITVFNKWELDEIDKLTRNGTVVEIIP